MEICGSCNMCPIMKTPETQKFHSYIQLYSNQHIYNISASNTICSSYFCNWYIETFLIYIYIYICFVIPTFLQFYFWFSIFLIVHYFSNIPVLGGTDRLFFQCFCILLNVILRRVLLLIIFLLLFLNTAHCSKIWISGLIMFICNNN